MTGKRFIVDECGTLIDTSNGNNYDYMDEIVGLLNNQQEKLNEYEQKRVTICVDFDGVLNNYTHYDENDLFTPRKGAKAFIDTLNKKYNVVILTSRNTGKVKKWIKKYKFEVEDVTNIKIPALCYIDDRAIKFNGSFSQVLAELENYRTYWE